MMTTFAVQCPYCPAKLNAPVTMAGRKIKCPKCAQTIRLGEPDSAPPPAPPPPPVRAPARPSPIQAPPGDYPRASRDRDGRGEDDDRDRGRHDPEDDEGRRPPRRRRQEEDEEDDRDAPSGKGGTTRIVVRNEFPGGYNAPPKSVAAAIVLAFFFGPLGLLYSSVIGAVVMFFAETFALVFTFGLGLLLTHPICVAWAAVAANRHNARCRQQW